MQSNDTLAVPVGGLVGLDGRQLVADPLEERHKRERLERIAAKAGKALPPQTGPVDFAAADAAAQPDFDIQAALAEMTRTLLETRHAQLEAFSAAYLKQAGDLAPAKAMLVEQNMGGGTVKWFFAPRDVPLLPRDIYESLLAIVEEVARDGGRTAAANAARQLGPMMREALDDIDENMRREAERLIAQQAAIKEAAQADATAKLLQNGITDGPDGEHSNSPTVQQRLVADLERMARGE